MASQELAGRTALVTGGSRGIGSAVCARLACEGARVALNYAGNEQAARETERLVRAEGADCVLLKADVSDAAAVTAMVTEAERTLGPIDLLVTSAGIAPTEARGEVGFDTWRRIMAVNLDGTFLTNHYAQKPMRDAGYGRIVNIASNVVLAGTPNLAHYVASKGGIFAFTRALAREIGKYGITVNSVAPGLTETEGVMASPHKEAFEFVQMLQCIPRRGLAADIAPAVAFLASEEAGWVTGQMLVADAGMSHN
jgi:pyridoxal 4-dehydrogenase